MIITRLFFYYDFHPEFVFEAKLRVFVIMLMVVRGTTPAVPWDREAKGCVGTCPAA